MSKSQTCPICNRNRIEEHSPFCSSRCRDRDLTQWFSDGYAVPGRFVTPEELARDNLDGQAKLH